MKKKAKKLVLAKETVRNLGGWDLGWVLGGFTGLRSVCLCLEPHTDNSCETECICPI